MADQILARFVDGDQLVLADTHQSGPHVRTATTAGDGELPAANAVALGALWGVALRQGDPRFKHTIQPMVQGLRAQFRSRPQSNLYAAAVLAEIDLGSVAPLQYFAGGNGRVTVTSRKNPGIVCGPVNIDIQMAPGWHINSSKPLQDYLIPTRVEVIPSDGKLIIEHPEPKIVKLSFDDEPLSLYEGDFRIAVKPDEKSCATLATAQLKLYLQACTDQVCMPPETLTAVIPAPL